jgi:hypothetical protein
MPAPVVFAFLSLMHTIKSSHRYISNALSIFFASKAKSTITILPPTTTITMSPRNNPHLSLNLGAVPALDATIRIKDEAPAASIQSRSPDRLRRYHSYLLDSMRLGSAFIFWESGIRSVNPAMVNHPPVAYLLSMAEYIATHQKRAPVRFEPDDYFFDSSLKQEPGPKDTITPVLPPSTTPSPRRDSVSIDKCRMPPDMVAYHDWSQKMYKEAERAGIPSTYYIYNCLMNRHRMAEEQLEARLRREREEHDACEVRLRMAEEQRENQLRKKREEQKYRKAWLLMTEEQRDEDAVRREREERKALKIRLRRKEENRERREKRGIRCAIGSNGK